MVTRNLLSWRRRDLLLHGAALLYVSLLRLQLLGWASGSLLLLLPLFLVRSRASRVTRRLQSPAHATQATMGNGGAAVPSSSREIKNAKVGYWVSPYNPLDPGAPELPSKGEIKAVIPKECFERSYIHSMYFVARDTAMAAGCAYIAHQTLSTDLPANLLSVDALKWFLGWNTYAFWMGCIITGHWVLAHECGHGAFSPSQAFNDLWGFVLHQALLVPYFAWQYTHAKHHRRTNNTMDGESHVPSSKVEMGLVHGVERHTGYAAIHEAIGDGPFALLQIFAHLVIGWPLYLLGLASTGRLGRDVKPVSPSIRA